MIIKQTLSDEDFEDEAASKLRKLEKSNPESIVTAQAYLSLKQRLLTENQKWADAAIMVVEETHANKNSAQAFLNLASYTGVFALIGFAAICIAMFAFLFTPGIRKLMHGIH